MKKMNLNFILSMTVITTALFSCGPRDVTITKPGDVSVNANGAGVNPIEINKLLAISIERQIEPLYLLKAVLNAQYASEQGLVLSTDAATQAMTLTTVKPMKVLDAPTYYSEYAVKYEVKALNKDVNGNLTLLILKNKAGELIQTAGYIKTGKKDKSGKDINTNFSSKGKSELISIMLTATPGIYSVEVARAEETNSAADKKNSVVSSIVSTMEWDGSVAALDNQISMTLNVLAVDRIGTKNAVIKYDRITSAEPIKVNIGSCLSATGSVSLGVKINEKGADKLTPPKFTETLVKLNDSSIEIESFKSPAKDCATRPVVDYTRML